MSPHDFASRAGLDSHDSTHSLSSAYILVPKPDRIPLAARSHNVPVAHQHKPRPTPKSASKLEKSFTVVVPPRSPHATTDWPLISTPSTPFQPLPPLLVTSPLRLPSFIDLALQSFDNEPTAPALAHSLRPQLPSPQPTPRRLSIEIPSVFHPNSPYVPWPSPVRRTILRPLTPSSQVSRYSRPYSRSGARAPEPQEVCPLPPHTKLLRLSKSFKTLKKTVKQGVKHLKSALRKSCKVEPLAPYRATIPARPPSPPLSPTDSCDSSNTNTLGEWLRECAANIERGSPHLMTLEEYEERGSWKDMRSVRDESELHSPPLSATGDDASQSFQTPSLSPISPTCTDSDVFPRLSMLDLWPTPPRSVPPAVEREMNMPGGWNCSPPHNSLLFYPNRPP